MFILFKSIPLDHIIRDDCFPVSLGMGIAIGTEPPVARPGDRPRGLRPRRTGWYNTLFEFQETVEKVKSAAAGLSARSLRREGKVESPDSIAAPRLAPEDARRSRLRGAFSAAL
jgi:hypothetical protein